MVVTSLSRRIDEALAMVALTVGLACSRPKRLWLMSEAWQTIRPRQPAAQIILAAGVSRGMD
jgi:hypothetical protein